MRCDAREDGSECAGGWSGTHAGAEDLEDLATLDACAARSTPLDAAALNAALLLRAAARPTGAGLLFASGRALAAVWLAPRVNQEEK
jgi:hypothetical protein